MVYRHPLSSIQHPLEDPGIYISNICFHLRSQFSNHITPALGGSWLPPPKNSVNFCIRTPNPPVFTLRNSTSPSPMAPFLRQLLNELLKSWTAKGMEMPRPPNLPAIQQLLVGSWEMKLIEIVPFFLVDTLFYRCSSLLVSGWVCSFCRV